MQTQESKIDTGKALDADLVDTESIRTDSTVQDDSNKSGNDTYADDADIRPIYDEEPMAEAKMKRIWDVLETMNIELEHSVAILRKENETLKQHYKDLYDSIKITRSKTTEQTTSLLANNAELKAQIQEKVFAIAALKNDLRKLKGNSVDTKFDKTSVLGKPVLPSVRNQSVVRQPNAFKSARAQMSKQRFATQVDVTKNLSKPVTQHYLPKKTESTFAKPDHMIASSSSRNSSKNMPRFSSNDMVHNHYLDVAKKKIQERDRNSTTSEVNSRAKIQSNKTTNSNKPVDQKSHTQKPSRQIFTGHRWIPTGKLFDSCTSKVDSEPPHGSNVDIPHIHECKQTLDVSAGTSINVQKEQSLDLSADDDTERWRQITSVLTPVHNVQQRTPVQEQGETSSRHVDSSNMHTFYQHHPSSQRWTKDHPLEQVIGNPSQSVRTRRQLETDGEICVMFALHP
ncbi:hypothetical protein Tco_0524618 [Tanacetum coccineum]